MEAKETPTGAALREIAEETRLGPDELRFHSPLPPTECAFRWDGRLVFKTVHNFLVEARGEGRLIPQATEAEEASWLPAEDDRCTLSFKNNRPSREAAGPPQR